jgi:hypothetical protein
MLTDFCLMSLYFDDVPNNGAFMVTSYALTAGVSVKDTNKESDVERSPELMENTVA